MGEGSIVDESRVGYLEEKRNIQRPPGPSNRVFYIE